ncbi:MAG: CotH kinase family protein, partial [Tepidisphaeraceae bacterium]
VLLNCGLRIPPAMSDESDAAATRPTALQALQLNPPRGLYDAPLRVAIAASAPGTSIRYTTDGSMPTLTSGRPYTAPIDVTTTTVVHAIGFQSNGAATPLASHTYIFPADVLKQPENVPGYPHPKEPINNPGRHQVDVPLTYGMDPNIVNDPRCREQALRGLSQIPTLSLGVDPGQIFGPSGFYDTPRNKKGQKIAISFEWIDPHHPERNVGVGAAITGHSKQKLKRSFHIHFTRAFGPAKLMAPIFAGAPFGAESAAREFDGLILRAGNNRSWATTGSPSNTTYTEDEYVRDTQIAITGQGVHGMFVHLYLNGLYWGLYNLVERPDDGYGAAYFGGSKKDYFAVSPKGVSAGDPTRWNYMLQVLAKKDLSVPANYAQMQAYLDVKAFADYLIGQWFCGVSDWPDRNYWAVANTATQQPFRFYAWDGEEMIDTVNRFPTIPHGPWVNPAFAKHPINNTGPIVELWTALKKSPEFMAMFKSEVERTLAPGGPLSDAQALERWTRLNDAISDAIVDEAARWGDALVTTGRPTYAKYNAWVPATQKVANDLNNAGAKFRAALQAEGYGP